MMEKFQLSQEIPSDRLICKMKGAFKLVSSSMVVAKVGAQQCKRCNIQQNVFYTK